MQNREELSSNLPETKVSVVYIHRTTSKRKGRLTWDLKSHVSSFPCGAVNHDSQGRYRCWGNQVAAGGLGVARRSRINSFLPPEETTQPTQPVCNLFWLNTALYNPSELIAKSSNLKPVHTPQLLLNNFNQLLKPRVQQKRRSIIKIKLYTPGKRGSHTRRKFRWPKLRSWISCFFILLRYSRSTSFRPLKWIVGDWPVIHMLMSWHRYCEPNHQYGIPSQDLHCKKCHNHQVVQSENLYSILNCCTYSMDYTHQSLITGFGRVDHCCEQRSC